MVDAHTHVTAITRTHPTAPPPPPHARAATASPLAAPTRAQTYHRLLLGGNSCHMLPQAHLSPPVLTLIALRLRCLARQLRCGGLRGAIRIWWMCVGVQQHARLQRMVCTALSRRHMCPCSSPSLPLPACDQIPRACATVTPDAATAAIATAKSAAEFAPDTAHATDTAHAQSVLSRVAARHEASPMAAACAATVFTTTSIAAVSTVAATFATQPAVVAAFLEAAAAAAMASRRRLSASERTCRRTAFARSKRCPIWASAAASAWSCGRDVRARAYSDAWWRPQRLH